MKQKFVHFDGNLPLMRPGAEAEIPAPYVYVCGERELREKVVALFAKRYVDMLYVTGLDRSTADARFRPLIAGVSEGLYEGRDHSALTALVERAWLDGAIGVAASDNDRSVEVTWTDAAFGAPVLGRAIARDGYGGIVLGGHREPAFDPAPIKRRPADRSGAWPLGDSHVESAAAPELAAAADTLFERSAGLYGLMIARPDGIVFERYGDAGRPDRVTPSWSMTKATTGTLIGRLVQEGWLGSVYDRAPAPAWTNPRDVRSRITLDNLMRMRSGLGFPSYDGKGGCSHVFEDNFVYYNAENAFDVAQRASQVTLPGENYRYINTGINVLGAIIRNEIEKRGLPYHETLYALLADRIGMHSYQHSADMHGNFIASGAGFAVLRDYARFGLLFVQDGVWNGERLLPEGWVDYALTPSHTGATYAACFRSNSDRVFPSVPASVAWAAGASDQKVIILRESGCVVAMANEREHPVDLVALDRVLAVATGA
ncbi:MAG TPA: serine hydrolase [Bosea sp. (in: a-proteobacteria)]|jgi:CubicO group peptidase (beta-lactamase class C family)|uniref:serine hydrolase domain-containing protein n=1 Tax=Bosea sp. (in: a-proteobacteria) TaxID=1871050 RepID=UPI002E112129|nr:serine hydrolase [Bosea sp. (in: a-proteobacteria)]